MIRIVATVAVLAGVGCASPAVLSPPSASASSLPVMSGSIGWHDTYVRPQAIYFGAGGNLFVRPVHWRSWTQVSAYGQGTRWANQCIPTCAQGTYLKSPASLTMWRVRWHHHRRYFSRMTMRWTTGNGVRHLHLYRWGNPDGGTIPFWY
jgi:hypothetical protein